MFKETHYTVSRGHVILFYVFIHVKTSKEDIDQVSISQQMIDKLRA